MCPEEAISAPKMSSRKVGRSFGGKSEKQLIDSANKISQNDPSQVIASLRRDLFTNLQYSVINGKRL
jgi:hypothetical protein